MPAENNSDLYVHMWNIVDARGVVPITEDVLSYSADRASCLDELGNHRIINLPNTTMVTECELRCYAKGLAYFSIGFSVPYVALSALVKKSNPRLFRYLLVVPTMISFHTLTYIPRDLERCKTIK